MMQFDNAAQPWRIHFEIWGMCWHHRQAGCQGYPVLDQFLHGVGFDPDAEATAAMHRQELAVPSGPPINEPSPGKYTDVLTTERAPASYLLVASVLSQRFGMQSAYDHITLNVLTTVYPTVGVYAKHNAEPMERARLMTEAELFGADGLDFGLSKRESQAVSTFARATLRKAHNAVKSVLIPNGH